MIYYQSKIIKEIVDILFRIQQMSVCTAQATTFLPQFQLNLQEVLVMDQKVLSYRRWFREKILLLLARIGCNVCVFTLCCFLAKF